MWQIATWRLLEAGESVTPQRQSGVSFIGSKPKIQEMPGMAAPRGKAVTLNPCPPLSLSLGRIKLT